MVTLEDHVLLGGYGSACWNYSARSGSPRPSLRIGWPDQFIEHASQVDDLRKKYGLTVENAVAKVKAEFAATRRLCANSVVALVGACLLRL